MDVREVQTRRPRQLRGYHKCHKCPFKSTLTFRMTSHVMTHNFPKQQRLFSCANPIKSFKCSQCPNFQTHKLVDLKHHLKGHHKLTESKENCYECGSCSFQTHSKYLILRHKLLNLCVTNVKVKSEDAVPERSKEFQARSANVTDPKVCDFRDFESKDNKTLLDHIQFCHHLDVQYDNCSYKTRSKSLSEYSSTNKYKYSKSKFRKCEHCTYTTKESNHLKRHILQKHTDPEKIQWYECEHCSYKGKMKWNLKAHIRIKHTDTNDIQWFKCEDCPLKSKYKSNLKEHIRVKHTEAEQIQWFKCEDCSFKSKTKTNLKAHIQVRHTDADALKWFRCEHCSYKGKTKVNLKKHVQGKHRHD